METTPLQRAANRNYIRRLVILLIVIAVLTPFATHGLLFKEHHRPHRHHGSPVVAIVVLAFVLLLCGGAFLAMRRSYKRGGIYSPPALTGLPRRERRAAVRQIRGGQLSADPQVREAQLALAARVVRQSRFCWAWLGLLTVLFVRNVAFDSNVTLFGRIYFGGAGVLILASLPRYLGLLRGSRRVLDPTPS